MTTYRLSPTDHPTDLLVYFEAVLLSVHHKEDRLVGYRWEGEELVVDIEEGTN